MRCQEAKPKLASLHVLLAQGNHLSSLLLKVSVKQLGLMAVPRYIPTGWSLWRNEILLNFSHLRRHLRETIIIFRSNPEV